MRKLDKHMRVWKLNRVRIECHENISWNIEPAGVMASRSAVDVPMPHIPTWYMAVEYTEQSDICISIQSQLIQEIQAIMPVNPARFGELPTD